MRSLYYWVLVGSVGFLTGQGVTVMWSDWSAFNWWALALALLPLFAIPTIWDHRERLLKALYVPTESRMHVVGELLLPPALGVVGAAAVCIVLLTFIPDAPPLVKGSKPYFTVLQAIMKDNGDETAELSISAKNNEVPAENMVSRLWVLSMNLDPAKAPLYSGVEKSANAIGGGGGHRHYVEGMIVRPNANSAFVVFRMEYAHGLTKERLSQDYFFVFGGVAKDGGFKEVLNNATPDQEAAIRRYMDRSGIQQM